ncbi:hypothetical protein ACFZAM_31375 [Streptomyces sp. NPDC008079]|uniref:hypothetical protein n=1 Tax=Streptomyces sp. NPDC008079 TaxID=3364806 RepID=UPI0036E1C35D
MSVPVSQTLYTGPTGTDVLPNPFTADNGILDFWVDLPQRVSVLIQKDGHSDILVYLDAAPPPEETARTDSPLVVTGEQLPGRVLLAGTTRGQATWSDPPTNSGVTPQVTVLMEQFALARDPVGWTFTQSAAGRSYAAEVPAGQGYTYSLHETITGNAGSLVAKTPGFTLGEPGWVSCWIRTNLAAGEQIVIAITNQIGVRTVLETVTGVRDWGFYRYTVAAGTYQSLTIETTGAATFTGSSGHEMWATGVRAVYGGQVPVHTHAGAGSGSVLLGASAVASGVNAVALGPTASATGSGGVAVGYGAQSAGTGSLALGSGAQAKSNQTVAVGANANGSVTAATWTAIGADSYVDSATGTAIGNTAAVYAAGGTAVGSAAYVGNLGAGAVAIGAGAQALAPNSVALGAGAVVAATHTKSVAIGAGAATTAAGQLMLGNAASPNLSVVIANKVYAVGTVQIGTDATSRLGFFGSEGTNKPTVAGSTSSVVALQGLLGALAGLGLITNATT